MAGLTQTLLFADRLIHDMYGFHINGFVVDLVLTPGGIAALGAGRAPGLPPAWSSSPFLRRRPAPTPG